jgi:hypothetical protein
MICLEKLKMLYRTNYSWKQAIAIEMQRNKDRLQNIENTNMTPEEFDKLMASINRTSEKVCSGTEDFKIYTKKREYFPAPYHKSQWCASRKRELA